MDTMTDISRAGIRTTTAGREWWGWFAILLWFFHMNNGYVDFADGRSDDHIFWFLLAFKVVFALSVAAFGYCYGRNPDGLGKIAFYTTPVAVVITAVFSFLPVPLGAVLFALSPVFIAPAMVRRVYGVVRTARPGYTLTAYMFGIAAAFAVLRVNFFFIEEILADPPAKVFYLLYALSVLPAWFGVRRSIGTGCGVPDSPAKRGLSRRFLFGLTAAVLLTFWLLKMKSLIDYAVEQYDDMLYIPVYDVLPSVSYLFLGFIGDRKREKTVVISSLVLYIIAIQLAFLASAPESLAEAPLVVVNHFFGHIIEYFIWTIPITFLAQAKRPVFVVSLGPAAYLMCWAFRWGIDPVLPESLQVAGAPLYVAAAIPAIAVLLLLHFIFQRHREKTLSATLYALLREGGDAEAPPSGEAQELAEARELANAGLTQEETDVALLLIEGNTRSDILRKLRISAAEADRYEKTIRQKILQMSDPDPVIAAAVETFGLTRRETQILRCLRRKMTNPEMAAGLFISEATVKVHVHNLLAKLNVANRRDIEAWAESFANSSK